MTSTEIVDAGRLEAVSFISGRGLDLRLMWLLCEAGRLSVKLISGRVSASILGQAAISSAVKQSRWGKEGAVTGEAGWDVWQ